MSKIKKFSQFFILSAAILAVSIFLISPQKTSAACSMPSDKGIVSMTFNVATSGTYRVWTRMYAPSTSNNSYLFQIDETLCNVNVGDSGINANTWTWVDWKDGNTGSKINVTLTAGQHTVKLAGREASVRVDSVLLLSDVSCTPTDKTGSNCTIQSGSQPPAGGGGTNNTSTGTGTSVQLSPNGQNQTEDSDTLPVVNNVKDVPMATISAIANPTQIGKVLRGSYGWMVGLILLIIFSGISALIWFRRNWLLEKFNYLKSHLPQQDKASVSSNPSPSNNDSIGTVINPDKKN